MTPQEHLEEAERLLASVSDAVERSRSAEAIVATANVHARIAHASAALAMLEPRAASRDVEEVDAPGLAALVRLTEAIERLADEETR